VVRQVFLAQRNVLYRLNLLARFQRDDFVNQYKSHSFSSLLVLRGSQSIVRLTLPQYENRNTIHEKQSYFQPFLAPTQKRFDSGADRLGGYLGGQSRSGLRLVGF
jgi:hypothetical protein